MSTKNARRALATSSGDTSWARGKAEALTETQAAQGEAHEEPQQCPGSQGRGLPGPRHCTLYGQTPPWSAQLPAHAVGQRTVCATHSGVPGGGPPRGRDGRPPTNAGGDL